MKKKLIRTAAALLLAITSLSVLTGCDVRIDQYSQTWYGRSGELAGKCGTYRKYDTYDVAKPRKDGKKETIYKATSTDGDVYYCWKSTVNSQWYFSKNYK